MRWLGIAYALLNSLDRVFNMAIGDENILPAIVVEIEKETTKAQRYQSSSPHLRLGGFVDEQPVALVVIQRNHLIGEVAYDHAGAPAAIVIGGIDSHAGARHAILAKRNSCRNPPLFESAVSLV